MIPRIIHYCWFGRGEKPELAVLELPDADDDAPTPEKAALEADYVARRIRALIDGGTPVWENGAKRPAHYGDAVILLRNANSIGPVYRAALETHGIPVSAETSGGRRCRCCARCWRWWTIRTRMCRSSRRCARRCSA